MVLSGEGANALAGKGDPAPLGEGLRLWAPHPPVRMQAVFKSALAPTFPAVVVPVTPVTFQDCWVQKIGSSGHRCPRVAVRRLFYLQSGLDPGPGHRLDRSVFFRIRWVYRQQQPVKIEIRSKATYVNFRIFGLYCFGCPAIPEILLVSVIHDEGKTDDLSCREFAEQGLLRAAVQSFPAVVRGDVHLDDADGRLFSVNPPSSISVGWEYRPGKISRMDQNKPVIQNRTAGGAGNRLVFLRLPMNQCPFLNRSTAAPPPPPRCDLRRLPERYYPVKI